MDDIRATMSKEESKQKPKIEAAMGKYWANEDNKLTAREKKICYYRAHVFRLNLSQFKDCWNFLSQNVFI